MKKTVLFLMNGFGIEQKDSYNVYNSKLMPNLDSYTQKYLFSSIEANTYNFSNGYRLFSTGINTALTYPMLNNYMERFNENPNMNFFLNNVDTEGNIQLYMILENQKNLEHLKNMLKFIREKCSNKIYLHIVLTTMDLDDYKDLEFMINKINYDYKDCRIASVIGINTLKANNIDTYLNLLKNQIGEKWIEISRKFTTLVSSKTFPCDAKEFYVNDFKLTDKDTIFFMNYEYTDLTFYVESITKYFSINKYFSMFPVAGIKYAMFAYPVSSTSITEALKQIDAKALILADGAYIPTINYMANGLSNVLPDNISYSRIDTEPLNPSKLESILRDSNYDLIIINYQIDTSKTVAELQDKLGKLDVILKASHDICIENKISLIISSLYGMNKEIYVDNFTRAYVDFSAKVPVIVIDPVFNKVNFRLDFGNIYNLAHTVYTNINNSYNGGGVLIKKKSSLSKMIKK